MVTAITVILVISFLVFIHELGHFLAAKSVGVKVIEFSVGFPPKVISKVIGQTEYMLSLIPIGGYVRLHGQNIDDEDLTEEENYASKSILQRLAILLAGPLMNLVVAFAFMPFVYFIGYDIPAYMLKPPVIESVIAGSDAEKLDVRTGDNIISVNDTPVQNWREVQNALTQAESKFISLKISRQGNIVSRIFASDLLQTGKAFGWNISTDPVIGDVSPQSPADQAGMMPGDRIQSISGQKIEKWSQISPLIQKSNGEELTVMVIRNEELTELKLTPKWNEGRSYWLIGISAQTARVSEPFGKAMVVGAQQVVTLTVKTLEFLYQLVSLKADTDSVGGPIMIAQMVGKAAKTNISNLISLVAFISLQFAIFNLLPIPALDGGHIFFLILEKIKGNSLSKGFRINSQKIGFTLLISLIIYISIQDGLRLFG